MQRLLIILFFILVNLFAQGQGCSDAGACSAGSLDLKEDSELTALTVGYSQVIGLADKESLVLESDLRLSHRIFQNTFLEARIPYMVTIGNLGTTSGVGDLMLTLSQILHQGENGAFTVVAGGRLYTNDANKKINGDPLPMVYQSSLGTNDLITGLAWQSPKWSFSLGYQHSFGNNQNEYLNPVSEELPESELYYESAFLKRGDDLMLRIQRTVDMNERSVIRFGFLPIYRMQEDQIKRDGVYEKLPGSKGFTYNLFFNWDRELAPGKIFNITVGFPVHAREYRADGLTRTAIASVGLRFNFHQIKAVQPVDKLIEPLKMD